MSTELLQDICETRMLVGFLGEKQQASWWDSLFLSSSSKPFLSPIYPNSLAVAQYSGVCQAAMIVHDEHIGIGRHFHLYRLPDSIERLLLKCVYDHEFAKKLNHFQSSKETAISRLKELSGQVDEKAEGPIAVGDYSDDGLASLLISLQSHYASAFTSGHKTFPYMRCA